MIDSCGTVHILRKISYFGHHSKPLLNPLVSSFQGYRCPVLHLCYNIALCISKTLSALNKIRETVSRRSCSPKSYLCSLAI